ncbi:MAG: NUDIX hydrolase [Chlamydiota bacterium]|nr:NUDIX hydrolase [Chlamydiota bacterium]
MIRVGDKCLVLRSVRNGKQYWDLPGGRIDDNERIADTLKRELSEELPTMGKYTVNTILNAFRLSHDLKDGKGLILLFYKIDAENFDVKLSDEHSDFRWVSKDNLEDLLSDQNVSMESGYFDALRNALSDRS